MRGSLGFAASLGLPALALAAAESTSKKIGPWEIEATFKGDKFDRCSINRKLNDDIVASFVRTGDDLALELESQLEARSRQDYPVKMKSARSASTPRSPPNRTPYRWT